MRGRLKDLIDPAPALGAMEGDYVANLEVFDQLHYLVR